MAPALRRPVPPETLLAAGCLLALGGLVLLVANAAPLQAFDEQVRRWVLGHQEPLLRSPLEAVTTLGNAMLVVPLFLIVAGAVSWVRRTAEPLVSAMMGAGLLLFGVGVLKALLGRGSPNGDSASFLSGAWPSGHTATATVVYGLLGLLLRAPEGRLPDGPARWSSGAVLAIPVFVAVGLVYCDFHWLTDVLGGFLLGVPIVVTAQTLTRRLLRPDDPVPLPARRTASQNR